jgi:hypothetical protein
MDSTILLIAAIIGAAAVLTNAILDLFDCSGFVIWAIPFFSVFFVFMDIDSLDPKNYGMMDKLVTVLVTTVIFSSMVFLFACATGTLTSD